jgi:HD-like signal output (HDOD) protein
VSLAPAVNSLTTPILSPPPAASQGPYSDDEIRRRIEKCPKLASLQSINKQLAGLVNSEQSFNFQIAEIIRRDPSLTARLLRMVNSVYFGLSAKVNNIEEAVLYLGLRQIRELSMATPVIEDMERISSTMPKLPWRELWQHSIGTAIMMREILATTPMMIDDDTDYIMGLLHDVGKVVLGTAFPAEFEQVVRAEYQTAADVCAKERALIGWDHAAAGGFYLERHQLGAEIVEAVRNHVSPTDKPQASIYAAAVHVADLMVRDAGFTGGLEKVAPLPRGAWDKTEAWRAIYLEDEAAAAHARRTFEKAIDRLPAALSGMV